MRRDNVVPLPERGRVRQDPLVVLDLGTDKMCCLITRPQQHGRIEVLGLGHQLAEGLRAGEMVDTEAVEASIAAVVHEAEQQAGLTVREVVVGISAGRPRSRLSAVELDLGGRAVTAQDLARALAHAELEARADGGEILHALPVEVTLDGSQPLNDARGMIGQRLRLRVHLIEVAAAPLHNLVAAVERCHLDLRATVAASYASGLAALTDDELALGALVTWAAGSPAPRGSPAVACTRCMPCRSAADTSPRTWHSGSTSSAAGRSALRPSTAACCPAPGTAGSGSRWSMPTTRTGPRS
jgi:hypothetical protein